jgi:hypothetical protein
VDTAGQAHEFRATRGQIVSDAVDLFFVNACQYYTAGRYAAFAALNPVVGNLLHHGIEHFLKGALCKTKSLSELKRLGHNLPSIWAAFKTQTSDPALNQYDGVILTLHEFEEIRYPDPIVVNGMQCVINITKVGASMTSGTSAGPMPPLYQICLEEIDELVGAIFKAASRNPKAYIGRLFKPEAKEYVIKDNAVRDIVGAF